MVLTISDHVENLAFDPYESLVISGLHCIRSTCLMVLAMPDHVEVVMHLIPCLFSYIAWHLYICKSLNVVEIFNPEWLINLKENA